MSEVGPRETLIVAFEYLMLGIGELIMRGDDGIAAAWDESE